MTATGIIINVIFFIAGIFVLIYILRNPRAVFIDFPLGCVRLVGHAITESLLGVLLMPLIGSDFNDRYRARRKKYLSFLSTGKFFIVAGPDEEMIRIKLSQGLESINSKIGVDTFRFVCTPVQTVITPPKEIPFYDFHYVIQWMTEEKCQTVGLVEGKRFAYTVYADTESEYLIGQTDSGENFFIALTENYEKRQFLRLSDDVQILEQHRLTKVKDSLSAHRDIVSYVR